MSAMGSVSSRCEGLFSGIAQLALVFTSLSRWTICPASVVLGVKRGLHAERGGNLDGRLTRSGGPADRVADEAALIVIRRDEICLPDVRREIRGAASVRLIEHDERPLGRHAQATAQFHCAGDDFDVGHPANVLQAIGAAAVVRPHHGIVADRMQIGAGDAEIEFGPLRIIRPAAEKSSVALKCTP